MTTKIPPNVLINELLQGKSLEPLHDSAINELKHIQELDVSSYTEEEVRTFVINPIVRILGYDKGTYFSLDLEKKIEFLGKRKFIDYKFTL